MIKARVSSLRESGMEGAELGATVTVRRLGETKAQLLGELREGRIRLELGAGVEEEVTRIFLDRLS